MATSAFGASGLTSTHSLIAIGAAILAVAGQAVALSSAAWADTDAPKIVAQAPTTTADVGVPRSIPFLVAKDSPVPAQDTIVDAIATSDLDILTPARLLAGQSIGFVRVVAKKPGTHTLTIAGTPVTITARKSALNLSAVQTGLNITTPSGGASVWGDCAVAVEWFAPTSSASPDGDQYRCNLYVDGKAIDPVSITPSALSPTRRASFIIIEPASAGVVEIVSTLTSRDGTVIRSEPVKVRWIKPDANDLLIFEAEDWHTAPRPDRFKRGRLTVQKDPAASGGRFVAFPSSDPPLCINLEVPADSLGDWWQIMLVAKGDDAVGALPSVGINIENNNEPSTNGRIAMTSWHRAAIGLPFRLPAGRRIIAPRFENDFYFGTVDRNLMIDRVELARLHTKAARPRVAGLDTPSRESSGGQMMMQGGGEQMNAASPASTDDNAMEGNPMTSMAAMNDAGAMAAGSSAKLGPTLFHQSDDLSGVSYRTARVAWRTVFDGQSLQGPFEVEGTCWWETSDKVPPPRVALEINGAIVSEQTSALPIWWIMPEWLKAAPATNTLRLVALWPDGRVARSGYQHLTLPAALAQSPAAAANTAPARFARYTLHDKSWSKEVAAAIKSKSDVRELRQCKITPGTVSVALPSDWSGPAAVWIQARSTGEKGPSPVVATLVSQTGDNETRTAIGTFKVPTYNDEFSLGNVTLLGGGQPQRIELAIESSTPDPNADPSKPPKPFKPTGSILLESLIVQSTPLPDHAKIAPILAAVYPGESATASTPHVIGSADAVVVSAWHPSGFTRAELLIDGEPTGTVADLTRRAGLILLPVVARNLTGDHTIAARLTTSGGQQVQTAPRVVRVQPEISPDDSLAVQPALTTYQRAVKLLDRLGWGPSSAHLAALLAVGESAWLDANLAAPTANAPPESLIAAVARYPNSRNTEDVVNRGLFTAMADHNPVRARFSVWAANHFSTWVRKTDADRKWIEHEAFSRRGISPFYDLLVTSATSPAMVVYLDQGGSYAGMMNENYAREIMELHTVGVRGGYSQADVTALARLLTGWTTAKLGDGDGRVQNEVREYEFRFEPMLNDAAPKQVFGMDLGSANPGERYDRITAMLESLASHPATAKFISQKLAEHYISRPAPESVVDKMAETFASTNGNLAAVIRTCISSAEFWSSDPRLAKPLEYSMRLYRAANRQEPGGISGYLRRSRAGLFDHPTPEGLPEQDIAYGDSNAMIQRWKLARDVAGGLASAVPNSIRYNNQPLDEATSQRALDLIAIRLTGRLLGAESNTAALKVITESEGTRDERIREAAILIAQLPEGNLR